MTSSEAVKVQGEARVPRENQAQGARAFARRFFSGDEVARFLVTASAGAFILLVTVLLVYELWVNSHLARARSSAGTSSSRRSGTRTPAKFGALAFVFGTVRHVASRSCSPFLLRRPAPRFSLPELAPSKLSNALTFCIELLAAVPSVIYGLLGVFVMMPLIKSYLHPLLKGTLGWTPFFSGPFYGPSVLVAGIVLAVMILPFIVSVSRQVLLAVPNDQREGALALGATKWEPTWGRSSSRAAKRGIYGHPVFLALARSLGETMARSRWWSATRRRSRRRCSPGYSIAKCGDCERVDQEATFDLYRAVALIELRVRVLFALHNHHQWARAHSREQYVALLGECMMTDAARLRSRHSNQQRDARPQWACSHSSSRACCCSLSRLPCIVECRRAQSEPRVLHRTSQAGR